MKKMIVTLLLCLTSLTAFASCPLSFPNNGLCAQLDWVKGPWLNKNSHFEVTFWKSTDKSKTPVSPEQEVSIYSWMTMDNGMNHGGPDMTVVETSPGIFEAKDALFFMHGMRGFWEVRIEVAAELAASRVHLPMKPHEGGHH